MVERTVLASSIAAVRDAVERIRDLLPTDPSAFEIDRTAREVVVPSPFVAPQECLWLATHWLAVEGWSAPDSCRAVYLQLSEHDVIERPLAALEC